MKYQALIFDMDGTILNTEGIWERATEKFIQEQRGSFNEEERASLLEKTHGLHLTASGKIIKDELNLDTDLDTIIRGLADMANKEYEDGVSFIEGFLEFHALITSHALKTALATNANDSTVAITKKTHNLEQLFGEHIYNVSHVNHVGKPEPDLYLHAAKQIQVHAAYCVAIEDSAHGVKAAKSAGMFCIGINTAKNRNHLKEADFIIDGYHEIDLPRLLKK